jgi:hypothetical protein
MEMGDNPTRNFPHPSEYLDNKTERQKYMVVSPLGYFQPYIIVFNK